MAYNTQGSQKPKLVLLLAYWLAAMTIELSEIIIMSHFKIHTARVRFDSRPK